MRRAWPESRRPSFFRGFVCFHSVSRLCRILAALAALAIAAPGVARAASGRPAWRGPYLQDLGPTSLTVRAEVIPAVPATLEVTESGAEPGAARVFTSPEAFTLHAFRVTDLKPKTSYAYRFKAAGAVESGKFTTAPAPDSKAPFSFLVYGDNRSDEVAHAAVVRAMARSPGDFLLHTGDFVEDGSRDADWQTFFDVESPLLRDACLFGCVGNHELIGGGGAAYLRYFGPSADGSGDGVKPRLYGSFRWASARFFLLDAMDDWTAGDEHGWFEADLARADAEPGLLWRVVVLHHSPWSSGPHGGNARLLNARIPELLAKHHVDLVVAGHDHIYERGIAGELRYLVTGGGGAPLYRISHPLTSTRKVESVHHFVEATVSADGVALTARRVDGSVLERCGFTKASTGWDCDPVPPPSIAPGAPAASEPTPGHPASRCGCRVPGGPDRGAPLVFVPAAFLSLASLARRRRTRAR